MKSILQKRLPLLTICANAKGLCNSDNPTECLQALSRYTQCATCLQAKWYHEQSGRVQCLCPTLMRTTVNVSHKEEDDSKMDIHQCSEYADIREFDEDEE